MKKASIFGGLMMWMAGGTALAQDNPFAAKTTTYNLTVEKSLIYVVTRKDANTLGSGLSHDHAVRATDFSGSVAWNNGDASKCNFDVTVRVAGLVNDAADMRRTAGLPDNLSEDNRVKVKAAMLDSDQLDVAKYPTMTFTSSSCTHDSGSTYRVNGNLTIHGTTRQVAVPMNIKTDGSNFGATGSFSVNGSDFGVKPKSAMGGQIKNLDKWSFSITLAGKS